MLVHTICSLGIRDGGRLASGLSSEEQEWSGGVFLASTRAKRSPSHLPPARRFETLVEERPRGEWPHGWVGGGGGMQCQTSSMGRPSLAWAVVAGRLE